MLEVKPLRQREIFYAASEIPFIRALHQVRGSGVRGGGRTVDHARLSHFVWLITRRNGKVRKWRAELIAKRHRLSEFIRPIDIEHNRDWPDRAAWQTSIIY